MLDPTFMKKIYTACLLSLAFMAAAQQDLQFTQYMFNRIYYNPGVSGSGNAICVNALHRSQWVGFDGAPTSQNLNASVPLDILHGGVSLKIANDQIGFFQNLNAALGYAYQTPFANGTLGAGVSFELFTKAVVNAGWKAPENALFDPQIPSSNTNSAYFDMNFGVYYESEKIWAGVSSNRLLESAAKLDPLNRSISSITRFYNKRHYYVMGGYNWQIIGSNWEFRPSTLIKTDLAASPVIDVNATGVYNKKFWGGVSYRLSEAVGVNIGYQFTESLKAGYAYDIPISDVAGQGSGSHEIFLQYCFRVEIPPKIPGSYKNPRFL